VVVPIESRRRNWSQSSPRSWPSFARVGVLSFKYDPFGRRIYKSSSSATSVYAYDGDNLVEETNAAGAVVARYSQTRNIDEPLAMLRSAATSYYHADGLGSITSLSNTAGSIANTYTYDSFGKLTASTGSLVNSFQYTARELDTETGLYYYRARYYDPNVGRFLAEDPVGFDAGQNFYQYVRNNPILLIDPTGLQIAYKPPDPRDNTIVCDGHGGPRVQIGYPETLGGPKEQKCLIDCARVLAVDGRCPHKCGPLAEGIVAGNTVVCPLHAWKISLETGSVTKPESEPACVATYRTRIASGIVFIEVPESSAEKQGNALFCGEQNRAAAGDSPVPSPAL
jgi:RHS repeat-associated protein